MCASFLSREGDSLWARTSPTRLARCGRLGSLNPWRPAANPMRTRRQATIEDLRVAVECLPRYTRIAMLHGLRTNEIIVGAYSSDGGICPMLAAHRAGGRTSMISFAKAWDRFALRGRRKARPRPATARELRELI